MSKKFAVVYARYSSHRQGEQSIEGQLAAAYKYAEESDLKIIHEYIDRAVSGRTDNREQFQAMLKDTAKRQFDTIILWKIDRFGRNREEIAFNKYRCKKNGVKVVYVAESIPDSPEGVILESVLEGMAEYYSLQLSQNVLRGQIASAEKCQSTGGTRPLGYVIDPKTKKYVVDPETAPTVRLIFDMYASGKNTAEIVSELNHRGLRTARGALFTKNSLHAMLKNEKYIGVYTYNGKIRIEGGIPAIVDPETFAKVQSMLKINKKAPSHTWSHSDYILTDKLFCGHCGSKMVGECGTGKSGRKYNYYICAKRKRERACNKKAVKKEWIEDRVLQAVMEIIYNDDLLNFIADAVYEYYQKRNNNIEYTNSLKKQLSDIEKSTANILKAIEAGIFNETTKSRMDELDAQKSEIEAELKSEELAASLKITRDHILFFLSEFTKGNINDPKFRKRLIDTFINSIFVYDDKITITFNYSGDNRTAILSDIDELFTDGEEFVCCADRFTNRVYPNTMFYDIFRMYSETPARLISLSVFFIYAIAAYTYSPLFL